jgi:hypothetical protein
MDDHYEKEKLTSVMQRTAEISMSWKGTEAATQLEWGCLLSVLAIKETRAVR